MAKVKYLYGAAVQGIQSFIFQTNELKTIVEASELVEQICTTKFAEVLGVNYVSLKEDPHAILMAAGNIKYIFEDRESCEEFVAKFPREIMELAPGITISQAVVQLENDFSNDVNKLEARLRIQRNKLMRSMTLGLLGMERSRQTGLPIIDETTQGKSGNPGNATIRLCQKGFGEKIENSRVAYYIDDITDKNNWIAIIHIDGNGLGQIVQKVGCNPQEFKKFSLSLDQATIAAAQAAYNKVKIDFKLQDKQRIPIRPIVLGGDDHTLICRADIAIPYVDAFIDAFEEKTQEMLGSMLKEYNVFADGNDKLTACAGIAFIKSSFPFYFGYDLAESLCSRAKKDAKKDLNGGIAPSCLMFHKVQDSFVEDYDSIVKRELIPYPGFTFEFGPYYKKEHAGHWTIEELMDKVQLLKTEQGNAVKTHLRQWLSLLYINVGAAEQKMKRLISLLEKIEKQEGWIKNLELKALLNSPDKTVIYDMLSLFSVLSQETK